MTLPRAPRPGLIEDAHMEPGLLLLSWITLAFGLASNGHAIWALVAARRLAPAARLRVARRCALSLVVLWLIVGVTAARFVAMRIFPPEPGSISASSLAIQVATIVADSLNSAAFAFVCSMVPAVATVRMRRRSPAATDTGSPNHPR
jgi:hypothetical protein